MLAQSSIPRADVLGVGISTVNKCSALDVVLGSIVTPGTLGYITVTGVHGVMESQHDEALRDIHNRSFLSIPDGIPMVWVGRWQGHESMSQVCGPEFMPLLMEVGLKIGLKHYIWGGGDGVAATLCEKLRSRYPGILITGCATPPFRALTQDEELDLVNQINETQPHCFWVGLSTPKQERFMAGFLERHSQSLKIRDHGLLFFGVGAAFDFQAGLVPEAPSWLRGSGFEWFYRLCTNPKRLWKRYLHNNPRFVIKAIAQHIKS